MKIKDFTEVMTANINGFKTVKYVAVLFSAQFLALIAIYAVLSLITTLIGVTGSLENAFIMSMVVSLVIAVWQVYRKKRAFIHKNTNH